MYYFAYGSNMSSRRLRHRLQSARPLFVARLTGHRLCWHKQGWDGSGKCDAAPTGEEEHVVIGVLYEVAAEERQLLDRYEGVGAGYEAVKISLRLSNGESVEAFTYRATHIDVDAVPFCWYRDHVLYGAREHGLPDEYIARLESAPFVVDPDPVRRDRELEIYTRDFLDDGNSTTVE